MEYPRLLICTRLESPLNRARTNLDQIALALSDQTPAPLVQGALAMAVAAFEVALSESLQYYLYHFPEKLRIDQPGATVSGLPISRVDHAARVAEKYVQALGFKSFTAYFAKFTSLMALALPDIEVADYVDEVREVEATRNLLLHNDLVVNDIYLDSAGPRRRAERPGGRLKITDTYVRTAIAAMQQMCEIITGSMSAKYGKYTCIAANRRLWDFMFHTPIAQYDDFWVLDEERDRVLGVKNSDHESGLSHSEKMLLGLWRTHVTGHDGLLPHLNMKSLGGDNRAKVLFFLSIASEFPFY